MTDKKLDAIKAQIKTELDSMILKELASDNVRISENSAYVSNFDRLSDSEKINAVIENFKTIARFTQYKAFGQQIS